MMSREDMSFQDALERVIHRMLTGEGDASGLPGGLYQALRGSQNWEQFQRAAGRIEALEGVLQEMTQLARALNEEGSLRSEYDRRMN